MTKLSSLRGEVILNDIQTGIVMIGFGDVGIFDRSRSRTIWQVSGKVVFNGKAHLGHGSKISVHSEGILDLGTDFSITAESSIVCSKLVRFGNGCLLSWDILIMDTDLHKIHLGDGIQINMPAEIVIGDNVWIGCRSTILKGVKIASESIIGAGSVITKSCSFHNAIYAGNSKLIKEGVKWER